LRCTVLRTVPIPSSTCSGPRATRTDGTAAGRAPGSTGRPTRTGGSRSEQAGLLCREPGQFDGLERCSTREARSAVGFAPVAVRLCRLARACVSRLVERVPVVAAHPLERGLTPFERPVEQLEEL